MHALSSLTVVISQVSAFRRSFRQFSTCKDYLHKLRCSPLLFLIPITAVLGDFRVVGQVNSSFWLWKIVFVLIALENRSAEESFSLGT